MMADYFLLPAVGDTMVEGTITQWLVAVGDTVRIDQAVCEIETDKSTVELTTPFAGTVLALGGAEGEAVAVGAMLLAVGNTGEPITPPSSGETANQPVDPPLQIPTPPPSEPGRVLSPMVRRLITESGLDPSMVEGTGPGGRVTRSDVDRAVIHRTEQLKHQSALPSSGSFLAMPKVRKAIRDRKINPTSLVGSGPRGAITLDDLAPPHNSSPTPADERVPLSPTRKAIIANLTASVQNIPQFTTWWDLDATKLLAARSLASETLGRRVPWDAMFLLLAGPVFARHPIMTATIDDDDLVYRSQLDMGVAIAADTGLVVPVVRSADSQNLDDLCDLIEDLSGKASAQQLTPRDLSGAVATLNNIGALGATRSVSILPPGSTVIVSPGRPVEQVRVRAGEVETYPQLTLSGTFDHRVVDGGQACAFLSDLAAVFEEPLRTLFN